MNIFMYLVCWLHNSHEWMLFFDKDNKSYFKCVRCGCEIDRV